MVGSAADQQFIRYPIQLPVAYQITNGMNHSTQIGWTRNLGEGGACLQLPERLEPRTCLFLHLRTNGEAIVAKARVVWAEDPGVGPILHGVAFTRLTPLARQTLRDLIYLNGQVRPAGVRLPLELAVSCRCKGQARPPLSGWTKDISRGGLLLHLPQQLPSGTALVVTLHTPHRPLTLEGTVVWAAPHKRPPRGELIRHGLRFTAVSFDLSLTLARFLMMPPQESLSVPPLEAALNSR